MIQREHVLDLFMLYQHNVYISIISKSYLLLICAFIAELELNPINQVFYINTQACVYILWLSINSLVVARLGQPVSPVCPGAYLICHLQQAVLFSPLLSHLAAKSPPPMYLIRQIKSDRQGKRAGSALSYWLRRLYINPPLISLCLVQLKIIG